MTFFGHFALGLNNKNSRNPNISSPQFSKLNKTTKEKCKGLRSRYKERISIFKTMVDQVMDKVFQYF